VAAEDARALFDQGFDRREPMKHEDLTPGKLHAPRPEWQIRADLCHQLEMMVERWHRQLSADREVLKFQRTP